MPLPLQSKLLALLAELDEAPDKNDNKKTSSNHHDSNIRLIASTSHDLSKRVEEQSFRRDLFFRLSTLTIQLPALADREEDVILLARHFLKFIAGEQGRSGLTFAPDALDALRNHSWPGNVQELRNAVQRAVVLTDQDKIAGCHLALNAETPPDNDVEAQPVNDKRAKSRLVTITDPKLVRFSFVGGPISADDIEKNLIIAAVQETNGNISRAAKLIGMTRSGLRYRIERYQLRHLVEEMVS